MVQHRSVFLALLPIVSSLTQDTAHIAPTVCDWALSGLQAVVSAINGCIAVPCFMLICAALHKYCAVGVRSTIVASVCGRDLWQPHVEIVVAHTGSSEDEDAESTVGSTRADGSSAAGPQQLHLPDTLSTSPLRRESGVSCLCPTRMIFAHLHTRAITSTTGHVDDFFFHYCTSAVFAT